MTTTRINHRDCSHDRTPAARAKCRTQQRNWLDAINGTTDLASFTWSDDDGCMYHRENPAACDKVGAYRVAGDVWCATAMDEHRIVTAGCRRCGNEMFGMSVTGPTVTGACGPTYCHYADAN